MILSQPELRAALAAGEIKFDRRWRNGSGARHQLTCAWARSSQNFSTFQG